MLSRKYFQRIIDEKLKKDGFRGVEVERRENESIDSLLSRFSSLVKEEKITKQWLDRQHYIPPSERRKVKELKKKRKIKRIKEKMQEERKQEISNELILTEKKKKGRFSIFGED